MKLADTSKHFASELKLACQNNNTSLAFIKHSLSTNKSTLQSAHTIITGGTNWFSACVDNTYALTHIASGTQPLFLTESDFLEFIEHIIPKNASNIGLNFAYPLNPVSRDGLLDGVLISGSKEHTFTGMTGKPVGKTIEDYLKNKRNQVVRVAVANDTICLLLSGLTKYSWNKTAAGIVGTGMNFALFEDEHTAVNLESGNFDKFQQSDEGKEINASSVDPGMGLFEKEVSGAYLYKHFNIRSTKSGLDIKIATTQELDALASSSDDKKANMLAQEILTYSARLVAAQIAGIMEYQKRDLTFVMQGSLFWKGYSYKETVNEMVKQLSNYKADFVTIEHADLLGAAKLVI